MNPGPDPVHMAVAFTLRQDRGRMIAALVAAIGDFELAEECLHDAAELALGDWAKNGIPKSRRGWLLQAARRRGLDRLRRNQSFREKSAQLAILAPTNSMATDDPHDIPDHRLRLIFTCCHPALEPKSRVALTLRLIGGLSTEEIARAYLDKTSAMAARLTRAKAKIRDAKIPYRVPEGDELTPRLASVLDVIYLIFNEGYAATKGESQLRQDLCGEALFLARLMVQMCPDQPEAAGLLALIQLIHARRNARQTAAAPYVPLDRQDRSLWDARMIDEGTLRVQQALRAGQAGQAGQVGQVGPFQLQAAIAALHCEAKDADQTDWPQIMALYQLYARMDANPVIALNLAVARSKVEGAEAGLTALEMLATDLAHYQPFHAARAELLSRSTRYDDAYGAYNTAISLTKITSERAFLTARRDQLPRG